MSFFSNLFGSDNLYSQAAAAQQQGLTNANNAAQPMIQQAETSTAGYGTAAAAPFNNAFNMNTAGATSLADALGINGASGNANALATLQNTPGYQFSLQQGEQAVDRGAAAKGMVTSGNAMNAEDQFAQGLAGTTYQNYVQDLEPYLGAQNTSAGGISNANLTTGGTINTDIGNAANMTYNTAAGIGAAQSASDLAEANGDMSFLNGITGLGSKLLGYASGAKTS